MMRNWKWLGYPAILAAALAVTPDVTRAAGSEDKAPQPAAKDSVEILKEIRGLSDSFKLLAKDTSNALDKLRKDVDQLRKDMDALQKGQPSVSNYGPGGKDIDELRKQLDQVQQTLNAIRGQLPTTSTSLRPVGTTGRIRLVNDYLFATEVVVNGAGYLVEPGMTRELTLPAGSFVYRVPSAGIADQNRLLASGQTYTITVVPR